LRRKKDSSGTSPIVAQRRQSDVCGRAVRSGSGGDLRSGKSKFLCKRNPKEDGECMWWWIIRLSTLFVGLRREKRQYCGGETINDEWSYLILPFQKKEKGAAFILKWGKENVRQLLVHAQRGD
jgi:hypothetical protein